MQTLPSVGALVAQKYRIEALLGEGGMGAVFRAHHELIDKAVALKWLKPEMAGSPEARERFLREARAAARIRHPNVVHVYDVGTHEGSLFMVMELLEGESLAAIIERGSVSVEGATQLLLGAMRGVAAAHACGITHRDIKPDNIVVARDRKSGQSIPKILDFGISKIHGEPAASPHITQAGLVIGTPIYMSMEQLNARSDLDHRADIYSFGVLLYQLFTGQLPFDGASVMEVITKIATERPRPPSRVRPGLSSAVDRVVMKAMAYRREDRYQTLEELIHQVSLLLVNGSLRGTTSPVTASGPQPTPQVPTRDRAGRFALDSARLKPLRVPLVAAVGVLASLVWAAWDSPVPAADSVANVSAAVAPVGALTARTEAMPSAASTEQLGPARLVVPPPVSIQSGRPVVTSVGLQPRSRDALRSPLEARASTALAPDAGARTATIASIKRVGPGVSTSQLERLRPLAAAPSALAAPVPSPSASPASALSQRVQPVDRGAPAEPRASTADANDPAAPAVQRRSGELRREDL
jgi:eukaryotic-like serine/threonine-protein kinase